VGKTYRRDRRHSRHRRSIADGEFIVIVGPSGCGKSTLLRMVAGLETITRARIRIGGRVVNELEPADRDIAMVFQNYALYPHMSVLREHGLRAEDRGMPEGRDRRPASPRPRASCNSSPISTASRAAVGRPAPARRHGPRHRARSPAVFLFDEPLSNLDAKLRVQMRLEIKELQRKLGATALYVTHDQVEAMTWPTG
jgi:sn-glycerol 3-phosphate transport system ATP-binding protein